MPECLMYVVVGGALGFLIGLTGVGGGILAVPTLILFFGLDPIESVGTTGFYTLLSKIYAGIKHYRQETINVKVGIKFLLLALPGVMITSFMVKWGKSMLDPEGVDLLQNAISYLILGSIACSLMVLLFVHPKRDIQNKFFSTSFGRCLKALGIFLIGGILGVTSIGGGILTIPALMVFYKERKKYVGTSIFIGLILLFVMSCIYAFVDGNIYGGDINFKVALCMTAGSLIGVHYGVTVSKKINSSLMHAVVIAAVFLSMTMMILTKLI